MNALKMDMSGLVTRMMMMMTMKITKSIKQVCP